MNEWKKIKIDDLSPDILTGDYEGLLTDGMAFKINSEAFMNMLRCGLYNYKYRKPEPKQPTHTEIMTKWWGHDNEWFLVQAYNSELDEPYYIYNKGFSRIVTVSKEWFTDKQSADIPSETL